MNKFETKALKQIELNERISLKKLLKIPAAILKFVRTLDKETKEDPELQAAVIGLKYNLADLKDKLKRAKEFSKQAEKNR